ncbi:MAG TPA: hypothetical protein VMF65_09275, partial [Acidimicrobiales bacterium]|nr:hypothetical protein [Acidimicrobiales bacterium]
MRKTRFALIGLATAIVAVSTLGPPVSAAPTTLGPSSSSETCAWPWAFRAQDDNQFFPDSAAAYWAEPIVGPSAGITASGTYPDSRYFSLSVYTRYGTPFDVNGVSSSLPDYRIAPEQGSTNPW